MKPPEPQAVLSNRRWWRRERPFTHFVATDVFSPGFHAELEGSFRAILASGLDKSFRQGKSGYDAYIHSVAPDIDGPLSFFVSRGWHDLLASLAAVEVTGDVGAALHHHEPGSRTGTIHNDLNPGWFAASAARPDGINCASSAVCDYKHGEPHAPGVQPVERIRAIAMIYFLNNAQWREGNGGECALYAHRVSAAVETIPPVNNSLLAFECTPYSYHRFLANRAGTRDSVVLWLHRKREHAVERWGQRAIVTWSR
jgi:2OG-Fe(II) oxygenase superfamily